MKKEVLTILVYLDKDKILFKNILSLPNYHPNINDLFLYIREELLFYEEGISNLDEYFNIPNLQELIEQKVDKLYYTTCYIPLNIENFLNKNINNELYKNLLDLKEFFSVDTNILTFEELLNSKEEVYG